jgi:trk system potassium uptake protein TrkH
MQPPPTPPLPSRPRSPRPAPYAEKIIVPADELPAGPGDIDLAEAPMRRRRWTSGPWVLILGFGLIILLGSILLKLPWASAPGVTVTWSEAIFTATSATTVTGLSVINTANDYTFFGQVVILLLLQVGGIGFISFSVLLFRLIGRRITLQTRFIVQQTLATDELSGVLNLALYVLGITLSLEAIGAALLWLRWRTVLPDGEALWYAIFHAISSYCNAGFDLFTGTEHGILFGFGTDWYTLAVLSSLILLGGFGITVMYDLWTSTATRQWSLNTRITLTLTVILTLTGLLAIWLDPKLHQTIYPNTPWLERLSAGLFTIVSARTAGMTILPLTELNESTQLIIMLWMFIGGAPASMAGGVSTSTVGVLLFAVIATAKGHSSAVAFHRTLPHETISKAVAIMTVSTLLVTLITLALSFAMEARIFPIGFEVVSAFANTGYTLDFTSTLDDFGRYLISFTMFWGRLGPLTIVVALAQSEQPTLVRYAEEPVILG